MIRINERDQLPVTLLLRIKSSGTPATPSTLRWRLDCVTTQNVVQDWAAIGASSTVNLTIPASANDIVNDRNSFEVKRITAQANYGTDAQVNGFLEYQVKNNEFYT